MDTEALTAEELKEIRKLIEIEKIRKKKTLYSQFLDSGNHEAFASLYTEDALGEWGEFGTWRGRGQILEQIKLQTGGAPQFSWMHMTTNLWIEMTGPDTATSRCYLHDVMTEANPRTNPTAQYAIYEEDWVKQDGDWKIRHHRIFFLWPRRQAEDSFATPMTPSAFG